MTLNTKEVTYVLGAGASCQAMPLVEDFGNRFDRFVAYISNTQELTSENLLRYSRQLQLNIKTHQSFDTFFKKKFHQYTDDSNILIYKKVLLYYFLFEHLIDDTLNGIIYLGKSGAMNKQLDRFLIDPRYEALIAGLLKPLRGKCELFFNVNFVTWNYDVNLLKALNNFIDPSLSTFEFIEKYYNGNYFQIGGQIKVFHLNGFINSPIIDSYLLENAKSEFDNYLPKFDSRETSIAANYIKFSWETELNYFKEIEQAVLKSDNIILIGYSLPLYNRLVDQNIFTNNLLAKKRLIIQDKKVESIVSILKSEFRLNNIGSLEEYSNCNYFVVPFGSFKAKQGIRSISV